MLWLIIKYITSLFTAILVPVYWYNYGLQNFLWLSDIALFLTVGSLWLHSPLLMSMAAVGTLLFELVWNLDYFTELFTGRSLINLADYMFDKKYHKALRALSIFHVAMPIIWILYLAQFGYDSRALYYFTVLYWIILPLSYLFSTPHENINWVYFTKVRGVTSISPRNWVILLCICFPLVVFVPTHFIFLALFRAA